MYQLVRYPKEIDIPVLSLGVISQICNVHNTTTALPLHIQSNNLDALQNQFFFKNNNIGSHIAMLILSFKSGDDCSGNNLVKL